MPTTTLAVARQKLSEEIGDWRSETTDGAGNSTTLVCSALADKGDDYYNDGNYWVIVTAGTYAGVARRVTDFVGSSGTITVASSFGGTPGSGIAFELHKFRPVDITRALNEAAQEAYPWISRRIIDTNLITGNWLHDGGFEDWSSPTALVNWIAVGAATVSKLTAPTVIHGGRLYGSSACFVAPLSAGEGIQQTTNENPRMQDLRGQAVQFRALLNPVGGNLQTINIVDSETAASDAVSVSNLWNRVTVTKTINSTSKYVRVNAIGPVVATFDIDNARLIGPPVYDYKLPAHIRKISSVELQVGGIDTYPCDDLDFGTGRPVYDWRLIDDGTNRTLYIPEYLPGERKLRLTASGPLSTLSADTDTIEIGSTEPPFRVLVMLACHKLLEQYSSVSSGQDRSEYRERSDHYYQKWELMKRSHCFPEPATIPATRNKS